MTATGPPLPLEVVEGEPQTPLTTLHTTPDPPAATCTVTLTQTITKVGAAHRESLFVQEDQYFV